jgi:hypothetical protein
MKRLYILALLSVVVLTACSKRSYYEMDEYEWMRTHERGTVAYVDSYTGNYIVETYNGFSVIESWDGITPRTYDDEYANFSSRGVQTIYNYSGNYFSKGRVVESWLTWSDALYILDDINY